MDKQTRHSASRPKVHRLPQNEVEQSSLYVSRIVVMVCLALLLVAVVPALSAFKKFADPNNPLLAQDSNNIEHTSDALQTEEHIIVHDEKGEVVGQLSKMPADVESGAHVNTITKIDNGTGKELLNIIGKY